MTTHDAPGARTAPNIRDHAADPIGWDDFTDRLLSGLRGRRRATVAVAVRSARRLLGTPGPGDVDDDAIRRFRERLAAGGCAPETARSNASMFRSALRDAARRGIFRPHSGLTLDARAVSAKPLRTPARPADREGEDCERFVMLLDAVEGVCRKLRERFAADGPPVARSRSSPLGRAVAAALTGDAEADAAAVVRQAVLACAAGTLERWGTNETLLELRHALADPTPSDIRGECAAILRGETPDGLLRRRGLPADREDSGEWQRCHPRAAREAQAVA